MAGESYSGVYVPHFANASLEQKINIAGIFMGNAWIDPLQQYYSHLLYVDAHQLVSVKAWVFVFHCTHFRI